MYINNKPWQSETLENYTTSPRGTELPPPPLLF